MNPLSVSAGAHFGEEPTEFNHKGHKDCLSGGDRSPAVRQGAPKARRVSRDREHKPPEMLLRLVLAVSPHARAACKAGRPVERPFVFFVFFVVSILCYTPPRGSTT